MVEVPKAKLTFKENLTLLRGAISPDYFEMVTRPMLYNKVFRETGKRDPEAVHDLVLEAAYQNRHNAWLLSPFFNFPSNVIINVNGRDIVPIGTAAGLDKNGKAFDVLSRTFGFMEGGTVLVPQRDGNDRPRVATIEKSREILNAQGFPHDGLLPYMDRIVDYRERGGNAFILASVCGLPSDDEYALKIAMMQMKLLVSALKPYVQGFVWNPYSPNTASLPLLRSPAVAKDTARQMRSDAKDKLILVKIGPYEMEGITQAMDFVGSFLEGGGNGVVTTNTLEVPKDQLPESIRVSWGYESAGRSGGVLSEYRLRSVRDIRREFPESLIIGVGGIAKADDAYKTFTAGADMIELFNETAYSGLGTTKRIMSDLSQMLKDNGYKNLEELQSSVKEDARARLLKPH